MKKGLVDPVVPLLVNLYGHPLAGLTWEKHLEEKLIQRGWKSYTPGNVFSTIAKINSS